MDTPGGAGLTPGRPPISFRAMAGRSVYFSVGAGLVRCQ